MYKNNRMELRSTRRRKSLWDLNVDCLDHICSFLDSKDQLALILVCNGVTVKSINWNELMKNFTKTQAKKILAQTGHRVQKIWYKIRDNNEFREHFRQYNTLVQKFCPNAELALESAKCSFTDKDSKLISTLPRLYFLSLISHGKVTGRYLDTIRTLSHFHISNCRLFNSAYFVRIAEENRLKSASIRSCKGIENAAIEILFEVPDMESIELLEVNYPNCNWNLNISPGRLKKLKCLTLQGGICRDVINKIAQQPVESLETLHMSPRHFIEMPEKVIRFPNLRTLGIYFDWHLIDDRFLCSLGIHCKLLENLLVPQAYLVTSQGILSVIKSCEYLQYLDISGCINFNTEVLYKIVEFYTEMKSTYPLKIFALSTPIKSDFLETEEYQNIKKFVILLYDSKYSYYAQTEPYNPYRIIEKI